MICEYEQRPDAARCRVFVYVKEPLTPGGEYAYILCSNVH